MHLPTRWLPAGLLVIAACGRTPLSLSPVAQVDQSVSTCSAQPDSRWYTPPTVAYVPTVYQVPTYTPATGYYVPPTNYPPPYAPPPAYVPPTAYAPPVQTAPPA